MACVCPITEQLRIEDKTMTFVTEVGGDALEAMQDAWDDVYSFTRSELGGAPDWAEYVDRDGAAWSREGLLTRLVLDGIDVFGESHVDATIRDIGNDGMIGMLDGWIDARVFAGELVRLVGEGEA